MTALGLVGLYLAFGLAVVLASLEFDPLARRSLTHGIGQALRHYPGDLRRLERLAQAISVLAATVVWPVILLDYARRGFRALWSRLFPLSGPIYIGGAPAVKCRFCVDIGRVRVDHDPQGGVLYQPDFAVLESALHRKLRDECVEVEDSGYRDSRPSIPCPWCPPQGPAEKP